MPALVDRVDAYQRRHRGVGLPLAIIYKFVDDQGSTSAVVFGSLAALYGVLGLG